MPCPDRFRIAICALLLLSAASPRNTLAEQVDDWLELVRGTPYWASQGVATNLETIRRWVLLSESYCEQPTRHILFDYRGNFVGYIDNGDDAETTIRRLNETRQRLASEERIDNWSPGTSTGQGYPFALSCDQPFADMDEAIARMVGSKEAYKLWGTWDGMRVGTKDDQVSLVELISTVYEHRKQQGRFTFPQSLMPLFLGKTMIESGGRKHARSSEAAQGIMQLRPNVLDDCEVPEEFRLHRMVQVDCALRLIEQNHRNLAPVFESVFGHLPGPKRELLYNLLLTQAYQIGIGRTIELLQDEELGRATGYFGEHQDRFSAEDIQVGMIYHNIGRRDIGMLTLYYVTDAGIVARALCNSSAMRDHPWCDEASSP